MQEADGEQYRDAYLSCFADYAKNNLPGARRSIRESESETDGGDAATNNPIIQIRNTGGTLLIEDKDSETDDYPARENPPERRRSFRTNEPAQQGRNNSGVVLIEDVEPESDGYQPLTIEEVDSDGNLAWNDPSYNPMLDEDSSDAYYPPRDQLTIEENSENLDNVARMAPGMDEINGMMAEIERPPIDPQPVQRRPISPNAIRLLLDSDDFLDYLLRNLDDVRPNRESESEIENDSETERHERRGPLELERHFYECTLRSVTNKIRMAVLKAVTQDPDHARSLAFREACDRALAIYENAPQQRPQDN
ncbi:hypothetical protein TKK_0010563 [Trichogramma kaykai]|uniref:Uncharacterized protein n=1 Tax=Trichogramma kaykai TaxID=54128 RepID=A0ABD2WWW5_9HYME